MHTVGIERNEGGFNLFGKLALWGKRSDKIRLRGLSSERAGRGAVTPVAVSLPTSLMLTPPDHGSERLSREGRDAGSVSRAAKGPDCKSGDLVFGGSSPPSPTIDPEIQACARSPAGARGRSHSLRTPQAVPADLNPIWPDDPNAVPLWRILAETKAAIADLTLVSYRTKAEFDAACALCEARETPPALPIIVEAVAADIPWAPLPTGPFATPCRLVTDRGPRPLQPEIAAQKFLAWLRASALIGEWSHEEMSKFYAQHCSASGHSPTPENVLRAALDGLPGASRVQDDRRVKGQRYRPVVWKITEGGAAKIRKPNERGVAQQKQRRAA